MPKDWQNTWQGQNVANAWWYLRQTYSTVVPGHTDQLRTLSRRPIGG